MLVSFPLQTTHSASQSSSIFTQLLASEPQHSLQGPFGAGQRIIPPVHGGNVVVVDVVVDVVVGLKVVVDVVVDDGGSAH